MLLKIHALQMNFNKITISRFKEGTKHKEIKDKVLLIMNNYSED